MAGCDLSAGPGAARAAPVGRQDDKEPASDLPLRLLTGLARPRIRRNVRLLCVVHEDHRPSLDIAEAADGSPLVICRACGAGLAQVCEALGLDQADFLPYRGNGRPATVATYPYRNEEGGLLFEVCRRSDKQFLVRRPDPSQPDGWAWNLGATRRVLYRLPELRAAADQGGLAFVVEGEKDVHALERLGLVATSCAFGAGKWRDEYAESFRGLSRVVVIPDDDSGGRAHSEEVARSLIGVVPDVRVVPVWPEGDTKRDAHDWVAAQGELGQARRLLETIVEQTPVYDLATGAPSDEEASNEPFVIETLTARETYQLPEPNAASQLLGPYVRRSERTIVVGDTGEGKTTLTGQMIRGIVAGDVVLSETGIGERPALIIDLEQGLRTAKRMIRVTGLHERDDVHIARLPDGLALDQNTEHIAALHALLERLRPIVVGLDSYYKLYEELDPNEERGVVKLMRLLDRLRVEFDFGLILPAHPRKDQPGRTGIRKLTIHDVAGSGASPAAPKSYSRSSVAAPVTPASVCSKTATATSPSARRPA